MKELQKFAYPVFFVVMAVLPHMLDDRWQAVAITFLIFSVVALSQDIILGKSGMFNMGQALFFGMGAYTTAILNNEYGWSIIATIPLAIIIPALFGILLAGPIVHLRGDYLLVVTIGFNIVFVQVLQNNLGGITGGPNGIFGLDSLSFLNFNLSSQISVYYFAFIVLLLTLWVMHNLAGSKPGRACIICARISWRLKVSASTPASTRSSLSVSVQGSPDWPGPSMPPSTRPSVPEAFEFIQSVLFFSIVLVGGSSVPGVLIGVFVMFVLPEIFREFATWRYFIFGFAMIAAMIMRPRGIWPATFGKIPRFLIKENNHGA